MNVRCEANGMDPVQRLVLECGAQSMAMIGLTKKECNRKSTHAGFCVGNDKLVGAPITTSHHYLHMYKLVHTSIRLYVYKTIYI